MQFIDQSEIQVQAGKGGDGMVAYRREKYVPAGGPAGADGGDGGSIYLEVDAQLQTLLDFKFKHLFRAEDGTKGGSKNMTGACGEDLTLTVPCGTVVHDLDTGEILADLTEPSERVLVAKGGRRGFGNTHYASNRNRAPEFATEGKPGQMRHLRLELKLVAEVGIVGLPNAGKSTLISVLSSARPKVADYPFTTLVPNLGVVRKESGDGVVFADIPGLIEGAHRGVGLGHEFLRHIERTRLLLHVVDLSAPDPWQDYQTIQSELSQYRQGQGDLHAKPQVLVLNKIDAVPPEELEARKTLFEQTPWPQVAISCATRSHLETLLRLTWQELDRLNSSELAELSESTLGST